MGDGKGDRKHFTMIPNYILDHGVHWDREVYIQIKRIAGEDGTCWKVQRRLAKQCGISVNRLKKSIRNLVENGWIKCVRMKPVRTSGGLQRVNEYSVADVWNMNADFYASKGLSSHSRGCVKDCTKGVSPRGYKENPDKEELTTRDSFSSPEEFETKVDEIMNDYNDYIADVNRPEDVKPLIREMLRYFTVDEIKEVIDRKAGDNWFMAVLANKGPVWFFGGAKAVSRFKEYLSES